MTLPHPTPQTPEARNPRRDRWILFVAQGFGSGRLPAAPGTWGSLVGIAWFLVLVAPGSFWIYLIGMGVGIGVGIWFCDRAEAILGQKDPGSIVLDEIVAMPIAYGSWVIVAELQMGGCSFQDLAGVGMFWWMLGIGFVAFRLFDALKPWPIRAMQGVRGGWGVVVDDLAAALCATLVLYGITHVIGA